MISGQPTASSQRGYSILELVASLAILSIVMGIVVEGITTMLARNKVETDKVDLTQQSREFMDQIVNDIHQSGFSRISMFDPSILTSATDCTQDATVSCGLVTLTPTKIQFEADLDGTGVSEDFIQLTQVNGVNAAACTTPPCVIQRGTISKAQWMAGTTPAYYTEMNGVINTAVFSAYFHDGTPVTISPQVSASDLPNISSVGITLFVRSSQADPKTGVLPAITLASIAEIKD